MKNLGEYIGIFGKMKNLGKGFYYFCFRPETVGGYLIYINHDLNLYEDVFF